MKTKNTLDILDTNQSVKIGTKYDLSLHYTAIQYCTTGE